LARYFQIRRLWETHQNSSLPAPTVMIFARETSSTRANRSSRPTKNGSQRAFWKSIWTRF
jgi:hypothetical protein